MSITPEELGQAIRIESLPLQWQGDSVRQKRDSKFSMLGKDKGKGEKIEYLAKYVDIKIVSLV